MLNYCVKLLSEKKVNETREEKENTEKLKASNHWFRYNVGGENISSETSTSMLLIILYVVLRTCMVTMIICNEAVAVGIRKLPVTMETALQDLKDYHADTTSQLRRCLTRSLDVASEAILADLDSE